MKIDYLGFGEQREWIFDSGDWNNSRPGRVVCVEGALRVGECWVRAAMPTSEEAFRVLETQSLAYLRGMGMLV